MDTGPNASPRCPQKASQIHMTKVVQVPAGQRGFAEDKDEAKAIRVAHILPALEQGEPVVLDFGAVKYATQSYVHALIGQPLKQYGEPVLDQIEFKNCTPQLRSIIDLVVDYSLGGFLPPQE